MVDQGDAAKKEAPDMIKNENHCDAGEMHEVVVPPEVKLWLTKILTEFLLGAQNLPADQLQFVQTDQIQLLPCSSLCRLSKSN
jgi:hypothetical protein